MKTAKRSARRRGAAKQPPPAMLRHLRTPLRPPFWPPLIALLSFSIVLALIWGALDLPLTWPAIGIRSLLIIAVGVAIVRWYRIRWDRKNPWDPDEALRQMLAGWMQANRERAPWN